MREVSLRRLLRLSALHRALIAVGSFSGRGARRVWPGAELVERQVLISRWSGKRLVRVADVQDGHIVLALDDGFLAPYEDGVVRLCKELRTIILYGEDM